MANLKAVLTRPTIKENYARNAFDRSFSVNTSYQLGGLEPIFAEPIIAGSHIKLNRSIFQRTAAVNTAAFPKIDTHVEFFAVPIRLLWSYWNNYKLNIQDFNSSFMGTFGASFNDFTAATPGIPYFNVPAVLGDCRGVVMEAKGAPTYNTRYFGNIQQSERGARAAGAERLLGALGYGYLPKGILNYSSLASETYMANPFKLLAYQKVYYDHFRNTAYESNDPSYYNIDAFSTAAELNDFRTQKLLTYRYINYRKDYFQSVYPALNYVASSPQGLNWVLPDTLRGLSYVGSSIESISSSPGNGGSVTNNFSIDTQNNVSRLSVQGIRAMFALDKLLRASAYAPKHVKDQFEARYGVKGVESGYECPRIGAFMNDIIIQEVTNTAANLGEIGGKGVGFQGFKKDIEFTAKEDSIIIGVMYSLPRTSYDGSFTQNWNAKLDREDFFIPEYMDLGMQPMQQCEMTFINYQAGTASFASGSVIRGYKPRYSEYKVGIDRNLTNFCAGEPLSDFVPHSNISSNYTALGSGLNANYFKVKPTDLDSVFAQNTLPYDTATDKFITHIDIKFICNQNMSVHGQPRSGGLG